MGTIAEKLNYLQEAKEMIKTNIENKGISVSANDSLKEYANKISYLKEPVFNPEWGNPQDIFASAPEINEDTEITRIIYFINKKYCETLPSTNLGNTGINRIVTNNGQEIKGTANVGDITLQELDDITSFNTVNGDEIGYFIGYISKTSNYIALSSVCVIYMIIEKGVEIRKFHGGDFNYGKRLLGIETLDGMPITISALDNSFSHSYYLKKLPTLKIKEGLSAIACNGAFRQCSSLQEINFDMSNYTEKIELTGYDYLFFACTSLQKVNGFSDKFYISKTSGNTPMFQNCYSLKTLPYIENSNGYHRFNMSEINSLEHIEGLDTIDSTSNLDWRNQVHLLDKESILLMLNKLKDRTGQTQVKLIVGSKIVNKLTDEEKAIATNKNWILE